MLRLDEVHVIRHKVLVEGRSRRQVAREMGVSRNTVRRYLGLSEPKRTETKPRGRPVYDEVRERMKALLEDWRTRTTDKQRVTGTRLHRALRAEGHAVGVTLVRDYLREERREAAEVYVPLVHRPGEEAQTDFFEVTVELDGVRHKAWMFLMRLMYSGRDFAWLYERCDQLSFLDGHLRAFAHFGGVPRRAVYDNLKPAVVRIVAPKRELSARFTALVSHYVFEPCFARPGEGHDKGGVEARGRGIRLAHLTPIPRGKTLNEVSQQLVADLAADERWRERFGEEERRLLPLPATPFDGRRAVQVRVRQTATVQVEGAWYSVPSRWAGLWATALVGLEEVSICWREESIAHPRQRFGARSIRYRHYLTELARKPQAVRQVAPELIAELGEPFGELWGLLIDTHGELDAARMLARVLAAVCERGEEPVKVALRAALSAKRMDLLSLMTLPDRQPATNPVPESLANYEVETARAADYDLLLAGSHA